MTQLALPPDFQFPSIVQQNEFGAGSSGNVDTGACFAPCGNNAKSIKWAAVYPQGHLSVAQGFTGQRKAYFTGSQTELYQVLQEIYNSHFPGPEAWCKDCIPVDIQWGPAGDERTVRTYGNIPDAKISTMLESYNEYLILVTYQLLRINDPWPTGTKPQHPVGTTLSLQVRGGGEILQIDPTALSDGGRGQNLTGCFNGVEFSAGESINSRIRIPLTEYHITCDRLTDVQLCEIFMRPWKCREGTVNCFTFMGEPEGTLLFDTWTLDQTWAPSYANPRRWRLSCCLKCRQVPQMTGPYPNDCEGTGYPIGWNHDYKRSINSAELGWRFIMMNVAGNWTPAAASTPYGDCKEPFVPRYPYMDFTYLFCNNSFDCLLGPIPSVQCNDECQASSCNVQVHSPGPRGGSLEAVEPGYEELEEMISKISDDARHAHARKVMRQQQMESQGWIEHWPDKANQ